MQWVFEFLITQKLYSKPLLWILILFKLLPRLEDCTVKMQPQHLRSLNSSLLPQRLHKPFHQGQTRAQDQKMKPADTEHCSSNQPLNTVVKKKIGNWCGSWSLLTRGLHLQVEQPQSQPDSPPERERGRGKQNTCLTVNRTNKISGFVGVPVLRAGLRATSVFFFKAVFVPLIS